MEYLGWEKVVMKAEGTYSISLLIQYSGLLLACSCQVQQPCSSSYVQSAAPFVVFVTSQTSVND